MSSRTIRRMKIPTDLTFFVWADTHFGYNQRSGDDDQRGRIIDQMNNLPGWPYPRSVGGVVDPPEFVLLCGDTVDGATGAGETELTFFRCFTESLHFPQREVMGNHDMDPGFIDYFRGRYGGLSTTPDLGCPLNIAVNLYGERFLVDVADRPEVAAGCLNLIAEATSGVYSILVQALGQETIRCHNSYYVYVPHNYAGLSIYATLTTAEGVESVTAADKSADALDRAIHQFPSI